MNETILVTGACGFTGSHLLEHLAESAPDATLVATDLPQSRRNEYYVEAPERDDPQPVYSADVPARLDVEFLPADLTDSDDVAVLGETHDYDRVFHVASLFDYFATREALYEVNVAGTRNLLDALTAQGKPCRFVHWSTLGVVGDAGFDEPNEEDAPYNPHNRYCESKVVQEQVVLAAPDPLETTILRPAPIYGPRHRYGVYHVVALVDRLGVVPVPELRPRDRQLQFPCVHVRDLVRAADRLSTDPAAAGETYHVLSDPIGQDELLAFLASELSLRTVTVPLPYRAYAGLMAATYPVGRRVEARARRRDTRPLIDAPMLRYLTANMWFSNQKLKDAGFTFEYEDPREGLRTYVDWCCEQGYVERREGDIVDRASADTVLERADPRGVIVRPKAETFLERADPRGVVDRPSPRTILQRSDPRSVVSRPTAETILQRADPRGLVDRPTKGTIPGRADARAFVDHTVDAVREVPSADLPYSRPSVLPYSRPSLPSARDHLPDLRRNGN